MFPIYLIRKYIKVYTLQSSYAISISYLCFYQSYCLGDVYLNFITFTISLYSSCACYCCCCYSIDGSDRVFKELKRADVVVLTYACDRPYTLTSLTIFWLPLLRNLKVLFLFLHLKYFLYSAAASLATLFR